MIGKLEADSIFVFSTPEARKPAGNRKDSDAWSECSVSAASSSESLFSVSAASSSETLFSVSAASSSRSSLSACAFCHVKLDDESDREEHIESLSDWSRDLELRRACEKLTASVCAAGPSTAPLAYHDATLDKGCDHDDDTEMWLNGICEKEVYEVSPQLMRSESAGPFSEDQPDHALGSRTIEQSRHVGNCILVTPHTQAELCWSDLDECLESSVPSGRSPTSVWEMRGLAQQLAEEFWCYRKGYESMLHTMNPWHLGVARD